MLAVTSRALDDRRLPRKRRVCKITRHAARIMASLDAPDDVLEEVVEDTDDPYPGRRADRGSTTPHGHHREERPGPRGPTCPHSAGERPPDWPSSAGLNPRSRRSRGVAPKLRDLSRHVRLGWPLSDRSPDPRAVARGRSRPGSPLDNRRTRTRPPLQTPRSKKLPTSRG